MVIAPTRKRGRVEEIVVGEQVLQSDLQHILDMHGVTPWPCLLSKGLIRAAKPGENVLVKLGGVNVEDIQRGYVLSPVASPCPAVTEIKVCTMCDRPE